MSTRLMPAAAAIMPVTSLPRTDSIPISRSLIRSASRSPRTFTRPKPSLA
jgi:hypothetical protein